KAPLSLGERIKSLFGGKDADKHEATADAAPVPMPPEMPRPARPKPPPSAVDLDPSNAFTVVRPRESGGWFRRQQPVEGANAFSRQNDDDAPPPVHPVSMQQNYGGVPYGMVQPAQGYANMPSPAGFPAAQQMPGYTMQPPAPPITTLPRPVPQQY